MKVYIGRYPGKRAKNQERKIQVRIDSHDTWNLDNTLAHIIHPALVKLKETKHGAPNVDDEDVPVDLTDHFLRWNWVLDEMIWAFGQEIADPSWEDQYHSGESDIDFEKIEGTDLYKMVRGPKDTHQWDRAGWEAHRKRMQNGFRLFGKYYTSLWD